MASDEVRNRILVNAEQNAAKSGFKFRSVMTDWRYVLVGAEGEGECQRVLCKFVAISRRFLISRLCHVHYLTPFLLSKMSLHTSQCLSFRIRMGALRKHGFSAK